MFVLLTDDNNYQDTQHVKRYFGVFSCAELIHKKGLPKPQIWSKMAISLFKGYFGCHFFVTIAAEKVKKTPDFYVWVILLLNQSAEIGKK